MTGIYRISMEKKRIEWKNGEFWHRRGSARARADCMGSCVCVNVCPWENSLAEHRVAHWMDNHALWFCSTPYAHHSCSEEVISGHRIKESSTVNDEEKHKRMVEMKKKWGAYVLSALSCHDGDGLMTDEHRAHSSVPKLDFSFRLKFILDFDQVTWLTGMESSKVVARAIKTVGVK